MYHCRGCENTRPFPADTGIDGVDAALVECGLEVEEVVDLGDNVTGPLVVGRVSSIEELTEFKKPIRYCTVDVGEAEPRGIICGARNFAEGDLVVVALPTAVLPGGFHHYGAKDIRTHIRRDDRLLP